MCSQKIEKSLQVKKGGAVLPGVVTTAARGNPFPMPLAIVTKSKMHQEMYKSNANKQTNKTCSRGRDLLSVQVQEGTTISSSNMLLNMLKHYSGTRLLSTKKLKLLVDFLSDLISKAVAY